MYLVFTMPKCPRCHASIQYLKENNLEFREIDVMASKENADLACKYDIKYGGTIIDEETGMILNVV